MEATAGSKVKSYALMMNTKGKLIAVKISLSTMLLFLQKTHQKQADFCLRSGSCIWVKETGHWLFEVHQWQGGAQSSWRYHSSVHLSDSAT